MKNIARIVYQWFNMNLMKPREYFLYAKKIKKSFQQFVSSLSLLVSSVYLRFDLNENSASLRWGGCRRTYAACVRWVISKMALQWRGETESIWMFKKGYFYFLCVQKIFLSLHQIHIEPLMADGVPWRCFSYFNGPQQFYLLGSRWDSHKPPGFHLKYLKLCSEDDRRTKLLWSWNDI